VDFDFDVVEEAPRWNTWTLVQPVQFEGEDHPVPRAVRLCCAASRVGDPVRVSDGERSVEGRIMRVAHSILHVDRLP
jgi:hypothetical protein